MNANGDAEVQELLKSMDEEVGQLKEELLKLVWHMRGGVSYSEMMQMSPKEREIISKIVKENLQITQKTRLPYF